MKIQFEDRSFIDCKKNDQGNIVIIISAKDQINHLKKINNSIELSLEEFKKLISDV